MASGNLFWPDAWEGKVKDPAYSMHGLIPEAARVSKVHTCRSGSWGTLHISMPMRIVICFFYRCIFKILCLGAFTQDVINQGKGCGNRDTESGQLLMDRGAHLDVLEYLLWINRWV